MNANNDDIINQVSPNKRIIEYISSLIQIKYQKERIIIENSIYDTTMKSFYSINELITQLEKAENESIIDFLINLMHNKFLDGSFFYLSQLCIMITYKKYTSSIEKYILDKCINHLKFSLFVTLLLKCFKPEKCIQSMNFHIEEVMLSSNESKIHFTHKKNKGFNKEFTVTGEATLKESRVHYYYRCLEFYENLKGICLLLFNYPTTQENNKMSRNQVLKQFILFINSEIETIRKDNYSTIINNHEKNNKDNYNYNKGFLLPFSNPLSDLDSHSYIIVNIIPEYSFCFNTKARVPIKLCCECIEMNECNSDFYSLYDDKIFFEDIKKEKDNSDKNNLHKSVSIEVSKQLSLFQSKQEKIFDKWANLEKFCQGNQNEEIPKQNKKKELQFLMDNTEDDFVVVNFNPEDFNPFGKSKDKIYEELKEKSKFKNFKTYQIKNFIAKADDDLKQEMFAMQIIKIFQHILSPIDIYISTYEILITSENSGLIEFVPNTSSIDGILKKIPESWNLNKFFRNFFQKNFKQAQMNFANSLAGFCLLSYYLQIKDRHNGNILLDDQGRISHIDFGFLLGASPKNLYFEKAEFKLTKEYVDILDGLDSPMFAYFKNKIVQGIIECKKHYEIFNTIINIMSHSNLNCYENQDIGSIMKVFQSKFLFGLSEPKIKEVVDKMVLDSYQNFWTGKYDYFQYLTNHIRY